LTRSINKKETTGPKPEQAVSKYFVNVNL